MGRERERLEISEKQREREREVCFCFHKTSWNLLTADNAQTASFDHVWGLFGRVRVCVCVLVSCTDRCVLSNEVGKQTKPSYFGASSLGEDEGRVAM